MIYEPSQIACDRCKREYSLRLGEEPTLLCDACAHEIAEVAWLTKQTPARADLGWRPIDSVPEDTDVIVWHRGRVALGRRFTRDDGVIWTVNGTSQHEAIWNALKFDPPKLWQPMLEAPDVQ